MIMAARGEGDADLTAVPASPFRFAGRTRPTDTGYRLLATVL